MDIDKLVAHAEKTGGSSVKAEGAKEFKQLCRLNLPQDVGTGVVATCVSVKRFENKFKKDENDLDFSVKVVAKFVKGDAPIGKKTHKKIGLINLVAAEVLNEGEEFEIWSTRKTAPFLVTLQPGQGFYLASKPFKTSKGAEVMQYAYGTYPDADAKTEPKKADNKFDANELGL